jgi:hypothetical protein
MCESPQELIKEFISRINKKDPSIYFKIETSPRGRNGKRCYTNPLKSGVILEVLFIHDELLIGIALPGAKGNLSRSTVIEYLTKYGFVFKRQIDAKREQKNLRLETNSLDEDFIKLHELISNCDLLDPPASIGWKKIAQSSKIYHDMAKICQIAASSGNTRFLDRWVFDQVDKYIVINQRTETRTRREHIVPCDFILRHTIEMYNEGSDTEEVAHMLKENLKIAWIDPKDAEYIDRVKKWRTTMPDGWKWGENVYERLDQSGTKYLPLVPDQYHFRNSDDR